MFHRVEFQEGTSDKFWEVEVQDNQVTTRWGRTGTAGQSKTKEYASEAAAQADAQKQLDEKLKKGYREVVGAAVKSAASPKKTGAEPPEKLAQPEKPASPEKPARSEMPPADWQSDFRRRYCPWRADGSSLKLQPAESLLAPLRKTASKELARWRSGLGLTVPTLRPGARWACELLAGQSVDPPDASALACLLVMTEGKAGAYVASCGATMAMEAMPLTRNLVGATRYSGDARSYCRWVSRQPQNLNYHFEISVCQWVALRQALATCPESEYRALLEQSTHQSSPEERYLAAFLFPDAGLAEQEARHALAHPLTPFPGFTMLSPYAWFLLGSLKDPALVQAMLDHGPCNPDALFGPMLLGNLGRAAFPFLLKHSPWRASLWEIPDPELAQSFRSLLEERSERARLTEYYTRFPHLGIPVLAQVVASNARGKDVARTLLTTLLKGLSELPPMGQREEALCRELQGRLSAPLEEAPAQALPAVLRDPPWLKKRVTRSLIEQKVELPDYPERIHWEGPPPQPYYHELPPLPGPADEKVRKSLEKALERQDAALWNLDHLSDPSALEVFNQTPAKCWHSPWNGFQPILARFGLAAIPGLLRWAERELATVVNELARVESPRLAAMMALAFCGQKASKAARAWMRRYPEAAALGLVALAVGPQGASREAAESACRFMAAQGLEPHLRKAGETLQCQKALEEVLSFDLTQLFPARLPKLPSFFDPAALARPRLKEGALPLEAVNHLATMLAFSPLDPPYAGLSQIKELLEAEEFAWDLFSAWHTSGGPAKEKWAFFALGHLGGDESARRLAPLIKTWPQEGLFARAEQGLDVLAAIGSDVALMHIHQMSQKLKSRALQEKARLKLEEIAARRGLTSEELADRLVSDLDLEADGSCPLEVAGKRFRVVFDQELKPSLLTAEGKAVKDLPKPASPSDEQSVQRWKALKKDVKTVASGQILRLELAMGSERRWDVPTWRLFLLQHPLLVHLVRRLIWATYRDEKLVATFRVAEDSSLADIQDEPFSLQEDVQVGLPHPLHLEGAVLSRWGELLGDYNILQPFAQLGRPVYRLTAQEASADKLTRFEGMKLHPGKVVGIESRGWRRGRAEDGGAILHMEKPVGEQLTAYLEVEPGLFVGAIAQSEEQTVARVQVRRPGEYVKGVPLGQVSPIALSDLIADLEALR
ncbi:MAG: hypothetical protein AMXMBFR33_59340 [Candidatus Xenobia bacterium]